MRTTSFTTSMSRLRNSRRTALLAATHWDDLQSEAPGLADTQNLESVPPDPLQLEIPMTREAPLPN